MPEAMNTSAIYNSGLSNTGTMLERPEQDKPMRHPDPSSTCPPETQTGTIPGSNIDSGLHRTLGNRQVQLIAIGGSIGTAIFVTIGSTLNQSGPASLLLAFILHNIVLAMVNNCMAEMTVYMPVSGGFIRMASKWVDDAWGFMAGWNFFFYEALQVPFEITAVSTLLSFWRDDIPAVAVCVACIVFYGCLNILVVKAYGESEFWLSGGKVILIFILFAFTFVTMVGGNPQNDPYGFRHWNHPGAFAEYLHTGKLGQFEGFLAALWYAAFTCVGPEYISLSAAEAKHPRIYIKTAFKTAYWRFWVFFIGSAVCVGIIVASNDPALTSQSSGSGPASSPYIIAMNNLGVNVLPHIVNALLVTTVLSAGNTYVYAASRSLYGLALDGKAPRILRKCTKRGIPIYCFAVVMAFAFLSFLQLSSSSATVLTLLVQLLSGGAVINFVVMSGTYIFFHRAWKHQGRDPSNLPYKGWFQPWCGYIAFVWMTCIAFCHGYSSFKSWNVTEFFTHYTMILLGIVTFSSWKLIKRTSIVRPEESDLEWDGDRITAYEEAASVNDPPNSFWMETFLFLRWETRQSVVAME